MPSPVEEHNRLIRWLASNRFHTVEDLPSPEMQNMLEQRMCICQDVCTRDCVSCWQRDVCWRQDEAWQFASPKPEAQVDSPIVGPGPLDCSLLAPDGTPTGPIPRPPDVSWVEFDNGMRCQNPALIGAGPDYRFEKWRGPFRRPAVVDRDGREHCPTCDSLDRAAGCGDRWHRAEPPAVVRSDVAAEATSPTAISVASLVLSLIALSLALATLMVVVNR